MLDYLSQTSKTGIGEVVCGISDFSTLWEIMLRETISGVDHSWNSRLPRPAYIRPDGSGEAVRGLELDIVAQAGDSTIIFDAKYYRATAKGFVPGVQDISKQIVYQTAVEATGDVPLDKIKNAFAFSAEATGREPFRRIEFLLRDGSTALGFAPILCQYIRL